MKAKRENLKQLMETNFNGSYTQMAKALEVDPSHIHRFINTGVGGGRKIVGAVLLFCKQNGLDFEKYIEL